MSKSSLLKNARNYAEYLRKKERGPVKAFFHITKNENVPAIEQQGLLTNHPNANVNSAAHPFRKHGTDAGGVWVTTEPTAFPVYGTTIGGKNGNSAARADALSTIKIEVPLPELQKMKAVQDPYGRNILRKGNDPRAVEKFPTWAGIDVPTTVLLNDVKPQWLKNIGYVEETNTIPGGPIRSELTDKDAWNNLDPNFYRRARELSKVDRMALSRTTGHDRRAAVNNVHPHENRSPARFVEEYLEYNAPITKRLPIFPRPTTIEKAARIQGASSGPKYIRDGIADVPAPNEVTRYSADFIPAIQWTKDYLDYVKPGESINKQRDIYFEPGAISRGMGGFKSTTKEDLSARHFNWERYLKDLSQGSSPYAAARNAAPEYVLDWDNIVYHNVRGYGPKRIDFNSRDMNIGNISAGTPRGRAVDLVTGELLVNPETQGAIHQFYQLTPEGIKSLKRYKAYDDIVKDRDHPTWQELTRVLMRINAGTTTPYW